LPWFTFIVQSPDNINFGTVVISTVFVFGGIPSTKEPICPSISNVSVAVAASEEEEDICAATFDGIPPKFRPVTYEDINKSKRVVKTGAIAANRVRFTMKYELHTHY
jgi:hypothetical protein